MSSLRYVVLPIVLPLLAAAVPACTASVEPTGGTVIVPTQATGTLVVDWTIELGTDPTFCGLASAQSIQIHVVDTSGIDAGTFEQSCTAFSTSIALDPGTYTATAILIDVAARPLTTAVDIAPFTILGNDVLHTPIDFPSSSFF